MKTKLIAVMLLAGGAAFAQGQFGGDVNGADPVTPARRASRVMTILNIAAFRIITVLNLLRVGRVTMLPDPLERTRRLRCALPATYGSTLMTASTDTARCLRIVARTGSPPAIMADASSPGTGAARGASSVVMDSAVARALRITMIFIAARSAAELSEGTISGVAPLADTALLETTTSAVGRRARDPSAVGRTSAADRPACDLRVGSPTLGEHGAQAADAPVADTDRS